MKFEERLVDINGIIRQSQDVYSVEKQAWRDHGERILNFTAMPDEIEQWYYASDPIAGNYMMTLDFARLTDDLETVVQLNYELINEELILGRGGLALFASTIFKDAFENEYEEASGWFKYIDEKYYQPASDMGLVARRDLMTGEGLMELCFAYIEHGNITIDIQDFQRLFMGAEMLRHSSVGLMQSIKNKTLRAFESNDLESAEKVARNEQDEVQIPFMAMLGVSQEKFLYFLDRQNFLSDMALRYLETHASMDFTDILPLKECDEIRMLAIKAQMLYASSWMSDSFTGPDKNREERAKYEFYAMTRTLQSVFGDIQNPVCERLKTPSIKGPLHEVLWFMDAFVLRMANPEKYNHIRTYPSYSREDAPRIGHPKQKRGFDFTVVHGGAMDYIQLKSSSKRKRNVESLTDEIRELLPESIRHLQLASTSEYHPEIWVLHEPNFMEVNPKRLAAKLRSYAKWYESGFDENIRDEVLKYVLQSVLWEYESISKRNNDRSKQLRNSVTTFLLQHALEKNEQRQPTPNREERRKRAKLDKKSKKS